MFTIAAAIPVDLDSNPLVQQLRNEIYALTNARKSLQTQVTTLRSDLLNQQVDLHAQISNAYNQLRTQLSDHLANMNRVEEDWRERVNALSTNLANVQTQLTATETELSSAQTKITKLTSQLAQKERQSITKAIISDALATKKRAEQGLATAQQEKSALEVAIARQQSEFQAAIDQLKATIADQQKQNQIDRDNYIQSQKKTALEWQVKIASLTKNSADHLKQLQDQHTRDQQASATQLETAQNKISALESALQQTRAEAATLNTLQNELENFCKTQTDQLFHILGKRASASTNSKKNPRSAKRCRTVTEAPATTTLFSPSDTTPTPYCTTNDNAISPNIITNNITNQPDSTKNQVPMPSV